MSIKKLPQNIVNILAAGEVVERPYSVVKELVENALDAQAQNINVEITNGWKSLIKVTDDGIWISKEDLPLTIEEFATSKISKIEDLYSLWSFWFRWEALSTISEVSKFKIITKTATDSIGWKLEKVAQNVKIQPTSVNFSHWTQVYVQDLFFNLPVRKKFLKSDTTEFKYIQELMQNYAIAYFDKWFSLSHNKKLIFDYPIATNLLERLKQIFPVSWAENYLHFEFIGGYQDDKWYYSDDDSRWYQDDYLVGNTRGIKLYGIMGKSILKFNSSMIKIFVNKRPVKDKIIQKAIMQAYSRWIEPWMYPFVILFLDIDASLVDVNVHPRKEEVKFIDPGTIYNLVLNTIKNQLESDKWLENKANYVNISQTIKPNKKPINFDIQTLKQANDQRQSPLELDFSTNFFENDQSGTIKDIHIIGQIFDSYILFTKGDELYIMDQHAVAERVIFEKMRQEYDPEQISLLSVPLTFEVKNLNKEILEKLNKLGFDISEFGKNKVILYAIPKVLEKYKVDISALVNNLLWSDPEDLWIEKMLEQVLATKSCKAAIKANHKLSFQEAKQLILDGEKYIDGFFVCQHGRPSIVKLNKEDIDKLFDRV